MFPKIPRVHALNNSFVFLNSQFFRVNSFFTSIALDQSSEPKEDTLEKVSEDSFILLEKLCDQTFAKMHNESLEDEEEDLLDGVDIPKFNDTLEEVEFLLEMGDKLKAHQKEKLNGTKASISNDISSICLSDTREATSGLPPPLKRLKLSVGPVMLASTPNAGKTISPNLITFLTPTCRSMINQVCVFR